MTRSRVLVAGVALATAMGLGACSRGEEGTAEQVGKKIDAAAQGAADAAAGAADAAADAAAAAGGAAKEAAHDAAGAVKDGAAAAEEKLE